MVNKHFKLMFRRWKHEINQPPVFAVSSGHAWIGSHIYRGNNLTAKIIDGLNQSDQHDLSRIPENGQFAFVVLKGNNLFAAVDHVRSIPVFYGHSEDIFFISDDAHWIRGQLKAGGPDNILMEEFSLAGFVTFNDTLYPNVKQLKPGECINATVKDGRIDVQSHQYYKYLSADPYDMPVKELSLALDGALVKSFTRLIQTTDGRTLVVPLSGGLDSRLVAVMLKRLGCKNVICFSYGKKENTDSVISSGVAKKLGYEWIFINYTRSLWKQWFNSAEFKNYFYHFADNFSSLPHIQDWPAVFELKRQKLIPDDSIFVPGHTGDFIAGGHIPPDFAESPGISRSRIIDKIIRKHYRVNSFRSASPETQRAIIKKIESFLPPLSILAADEAASFYECFDWQERQSKHVLNSLRIYEFFEYEWRIPLWDRELTDFWRKIPPHYKISKRLYLDYLKKMNFLGVYDSLNSTYGTDRPKQADQSEQFDSIREIVLKIMEKKDLLSKWMFDYYRHPLQWYGMFPYFFILFRKGMFQSIYSFLTDNYLTNLNDQNKLLGQLNLNTTNNCDMCKNAEIMNSL